MPGPGRMPKQPGLRQGHRRREITTLRADGQVRGPELPEDREWHPMTRRWWQSWRRSPQAQLCDGPCWDFLVDTALLHDQFWRGDLSLATELRQRLEKFAVAPQGRLRCYIEVEEGSRDGRGEHRAAAG